MKANNQNNLSNILVKEILEEVKNMVQIDIKIVNAKLGLGTSKNSALFF